jgi:hypothetical protein
MYSNVILFFHQQGQDLNLGPSVWIAKTSGPEENKKSSKPSNCLDIALHVMD